ncbi:hypothetical protein BKA69DRAFT_1078472 [Paraphysoderma sedebokerense]|nr:hypothetical protein BKA69DRAFT_1078472 [Paraphysoderma sedebokerense]
MTTAANCCRNIPLDCYDQLKEVAPILQTTLNSSDQKVLESSCFCWVRIAEGLRWKVDKLEGVMSDSLLKKILEILASVSGSTSAASTSSAAPQTPSTPSSAPTVSSSTQISNTPIHTHLLRFLSTVTRSSPNISFSLVKLNLVETLHMVITGRSSADFNVTDVDNDSEDQVDEIDQMEEYDLVNAVLSRPKEWIVDVLGVVSEILPALPKDGIFNTKLNSAESALVNGIAAAAGDSAGSRHTEKSEAKVEGHVNDSDVVADSANSKHSEDKKETEAKELKKDAMDVDYQTGNEGDDEQEPVDSTEDKAKGEDVEKEGENNNGDEHPAEGYPHDEEISSEEDHDSYSEDELPASPTRPISDSTVMSVQALNDQRVKLLHENMDIVTKFNSVFLPLLIHVFEASVNLRVRQRVMTAVLKIVCWTEEKRLVGVVRNVAFASFLANILSQKEHSTLVVAALQLASLMMEKLPEIYQTHFRRQGVMHEIESISNTSVDSANVATTSTDAPTVASPTTAFSNPPSSTVALAMSRQLESLVKNLNKVKISARQLVKSRPPSGLTESEESAQDQGDELMETDDNSNIMLRKNLDQLQKALLEATEAVDEAESYAERNSKKEQKKKEIEKADTEKETDAIQSVEADERMSDNTEDKSDDKQKGKAKVPTSAEASSSGSVPTESDNITATSQGSEFSKARLESLKTNIQKLQNQTLTLLRSSPYYTSLASPNPSSSSYALYNSSGDGPGLGSAQIRDWIIHTSKDFMKKYNHQATVTKAETIMNDLKQIAEVVSQTKAERGSQTVNSALLKLRDHLRSGEDTMSSFEFLGSGVLLALVQFFTAVGDEHNATDQIDRLKSFADIFMSNESADAKSDNHRPFAHLIKRLQELTSRLEPFTITGGSGSFMDDGRVGSTSMLARQVKIKLVSDDPDVPRTCNNILVSVHAIATFSALDDFLRPRIGSRQARGPQSPSTGSSANQQRAESRLKDKLRSFASRVSEVLGGTSDGEIDSDEDSETDLLDSIFGARRSLSSNASDTDTPRRDSVVDLKTDDARTPIESSSSDTVPAAAASTPSKEEEKEKPVTSPSPDDKEKPKEPEATSTPGPSTSSSSVPPTSGSRKRSKGSSSGLPHPSLSSTMAPSSSQDWHLEFSIGDIPVESDKTIYAAVHMFEENLPTKSRSVWSNVYTVKYKRVPGPKPKKTTSLSSSSLCDSADSNRNLFTKELPMSLAKDEVFANVLVILRSLYNLNSQGTDLFQSDKCAISVLPPAYFINPKLTAKLNRQLEEPLLVASSCLPDWALSLPKELPFLFPFETRQLFLQSTSFGYSRSINRWNSRTGSDRRDEQPPLGRVQRQKVRIQRQKMLEAAKKVMNMFGPERSMLEIEYFEEVGTGLGPTLEFYSSVSKEFRKKGLNMWRDEQPSEGEYVISALGLFPSPMTTDFADTKDGKNRLELWKTLGTFCAKAMLDSRLIDLPFSIFFFKRLFSPSSSFGLYALKDIDPQLHKSLVSLQEYVVLKKKVYADDTLSNADKESKVKEIRIKDVAVDDLCLDFTLPGYNEVELKPKGSEISVTIFNIEEYIQGVINTTVGTGVQKQFKSFKEGFNLVFPVDDLKLFTEEELSMMFGSGEEDWSYDALAEAVKADHGYTMNSKTIKNLLTVLSELGSAEKREFSQWLTGSPKLPIGGFKNLNPAFTIVRKSVESPLTADDYLPSVMTCVNYLKLPDYSSLEVMKKKLLTAIKEGQGSFLLS